MDLLNAYERINPVHLVCQHWHALSKANPAKYKLISTSLEPNTPANFCHMLACAEKCLESVHLNLHLELPRVAVSRLLSVLAIAHPQLRHLAIQCPSYDTKVYKSWDRASLKREGNDWDNWAGALSLMHQLQKLEIMDARFVPWMRSGDDLWGRSPQPRDEDEDPATHDFFSCMKLKELYIYRAQEVNFDYDEPFYSIALGEALLALTRLTKLHLEITNSGRSCVGDIEDSDWDYIAANVCTLHQLRCVTLDSNNRMVIDEEWSLMTDLTHLSLKGQLERCHNIEHLPALRSLELHYLKPLSTSENPLTTLALESLPGLENLALRSTDYVHQEHLAIMLPRHALAGLSGLTSFTLSLGPSLTSVPVVDGLLDCMPRLAHVSLAGNGLYRLPTSMSRLPNLQKLDVTGNPVSGAPASGS